MKKAIHIILISMVLLGVAFQNARAETRQRVISPAEAKKIAEERFGGQALSIRLDAGGPSGPVYRVKLIKAGRVKTVNIEATP